MEDMLGWWFYDDVEWMKNTYDDALERRMEDT